MRSVPSKVVFGSENAYGTFNKYIEDIRIGDMVLSFNETTGQKEYRRVYELFVHDVARIYEITYSDGSTIETTYNHPFYIQRGMASMQNRPRMLNVSFSGDKPVLKTISKGWIEAKDIRAGDSSVQADGSLLRIVSVNVDRRYEKVYNFEVEGNHTYYVGESGLLVHNYDVVKDDTVYSLAKRNGVTQQEIIDRNPFLADRCKAGGKCIIKTGEYLDLNFPERADSYQESLSPMARFVAENPNAAQQIGRFQSGAENITTNSVRFATRIGLNEPPESGHEGTQVNAFRHVLWQASIASELGTEVAEQVGNAHEPNPTVHLQPNAITRVYKGLAGRAAADSVVDLMNNITGRRIGQQNPGLPMNRLASKVTESYRNNGFYLVKRDSNNNYRIVKQRLPRTQYQKSQNTITNLNPNGRTEQEQTNVLWERLNQVRGGP